MTEIPEPVPANKDDQEKAIERLTTLRLARARRLSRTAWIISSIIALAIILLAIFPLFEIMVRQDAKPPAQDTTSWIILAISTVALMILATRLYTQQLIRFYLQAGVIERQNANLRITSTRLQQEIQEREQAETQRDNFFNLSTDFLAILSTDGRIDRANPALIRSLNEQEETLRGAELCSFHHSADIDAVRLTLKQAEEESGETTAVRSIEARLLSNRTTLWVLWTFVVSSNRVYAVGHDVTPHRAAEAALKEAKNAAEKANETKTRFLANMSHELRTPLNAIIGFSETLEMGILGELTQKQKEYIHDIHGAGQHLLTIVTDLLNVSVIDSGKMPLHEKEIDPHEMAENALSLVRSRANSKNITLALSPLTRETETAKQSQVKLRADIVKLRQILVNLLSNAIKYTPENGEIKVTFSLLEDGYTITVKDTGIGIDPADIATVLSPFGRLQSKDKDSEGGVGLGLPLASRLAELHEGHLSLTSEPNKGTSVTLWLPKERIIEN